MTEVSVTVTVGEGSERHNHDLEYRTTLSHVHSRDEGVIELIPYRPYQKQVNEAMKPYIDKYNAQVEERYQAAWQRYNDGLIKTKPRKRDYAKMEYDYYTEHLGDQSKNARTGKMEPAPMIRSLIVGIGDKDDRQSGRVTEKQAEAIFKKVVEGFKEKFPDFMLLGASLHLDEEGFYHAHIDYKPIYEKQKEAPVNSDPVGSDRAEEAAKEKKHRGLDVGIGHDAALEHMGYTPEQSIINGRDKAPLLFNAFRNEIYRLMETAMAENGLRLQYGVSKVKEPTKDSSRNQKLEIWQATQDEARELQHQKNELLDALEQGAPEGIVEASKAAEKIAAQLDAVKNSPQTVTRKGYEVSFTLFDQMQSFLRSLAAAVERVKEYRPPAKELRESRRELAENRQKVEEGLQKVQQISGTVKERQAAADKLEADVGALQIRAKTERAEVNELIDKKKEARQEYLQTYSDLQKANAKLQELRDDIEVMDVEVTVRQDLIAGYDGKIEELQDAHHEVDNSLFEKRRELEKVENTLQKGREGLQKVREGIDKARVEVDDLRAEKTALTASLSDLGAKRAELIEEVTILQEAAKREYSTGARKHGHEWERAIEESRQHRELIKKNELLEAKVSVYEQILQELPAFWRRAQERLAEMFRGKEKNKKRSQPAQTK